MTKGLAELEELERERTILDAFADEMMKRPFGKRWLSGQEADRIVARLQEIGEAQA